VTVGRGGVEKSSVPRTLEESYDAVVSSAVPVVFAGLCAFSGVLAVENALTLEAADRVVATATAGGVAVLLAMLALLTRRRAVPLRWAHPVTSAAIVAAAVSPVLVMVLTEAPRQSTMLVVAAAAAGCALVALRWLVATLYLLWGGWTAAALVIGPSREWIHYAVAMSLVTGLALAINHVRRAAVRDLAAAANLADAAAVRDQLTGLANRRGLAMVGGQIVELARRQGDAAHCIFVEIGGLKQVNTHLGTEAGDEVIVAVGEALREVTRATDVVARWAGDEFCVVGPGPGMAPLELERRLRDTVQLHAPVPAEVWPVLVSAGGAMLAPWDSGTLETLLGKADQEMHLRRSLRRESAPASRRPATSTD
jgi:diguanylate cyclase (GGDEF)-like protein